MAAQFHSVLIVGSSGMLGGKIAQSFLDRKIFDVKILIRPDTAKEKVAKLKEQGATLVEGDTSSVESLKKAFHGVDVVVSVLSGGGFAHQNNLITAAKEANVKRFIPSEFGIQIEKGTEWPLFGPKLGTREHLKKTGIDFTLVVTGFFIDTSILPWLGVDWDNGKATIVGDGNYKISLTLTDDIARILPDILLDPTSKNAEIRLIGDTLSWNDAIKHFEKARGQTLERVNVGSDYLEKPFKENPNPWATIPQQLWLSITKGQAVVDLPHYSTTSHLATVSEYARHFSKKH